MPGIKRLTSFSKRLQVLLLGLLLASCSTLENQNSPSHVSPLFPLLASCRSERVQPSPELISHPVFSQLAANRFLLSFRHDLREYPQWRDWVHRVVKLRAQDATVSISAACLDALLSHEVFQLRDQLFTGWQQNLYRPWPLIAHVMKPFVNRGVLQELSAQHDIEKQYRAVAHPLDLGMLADRQWYGAQAIAMEPLTFDQLSVDHLGIPQLSPQEEKQLLDLWQPIWAIEERAHNDRPMRVERREAEVHFKHEPSIYRYVSFARLGGEILVQLNYLIWFSERRADGPLDILAGQLDGIHFRSYLDRRGHLLAHDAMHHCGCWYQLYPSPKLHQSVKAAGEPSYHSRFWPGNKAPIVLISSNQHRVEALLPHRDSPWRRHGATLTPLHKRLYSELAGLFNASGLIPESKRPERFLFAPLGVKAAGSMRSRGRHQIAFTSERYFDAPFLLKSLGYRRVSPLLKSPASD
ncbi:hypothetical protein [Pseudoteredinibacter isoporae]|uniref:hypothetical protein n=1 Tax=Pseudoteredinibacter isoporae TaxID=570281 RepID=UPI0031095365